ncbi:MAG: glycosyltransferase family 2 protein [Cytophagales bacterium]|nr:MAG: glycosyltransferase family 2 protein [Cytophagales bacterium]TAF60106.1 MAG: glycosyltransferase family 2 protein [Cytophagales bacterium]
MPSISVVVITFNEAKNLRRCLKSVRGVADEIVVVDSFSTDQTESIARELGARFIQHTFEGHIEQKNWAISQATFPHVLSLDADEALSETLRASILKVKQLWTHDGYSFNRLTNYCGHWVRHCGWYPDVKLRLWDSRMGAWGGQNPHDTYLMSAQAQTTSLEGDLLHYSYYSISEHIAQLNKFTTIGAEADFKKGKRVSVLGMVFKSIWKFIRDFVFKKGFLDGYTGFLVCAISAFASFSKYIKIRELENKAKML